MVNFKILLVFLGISVNSGLFLNYFWVFIVNFIFCYTSDKHCIWIVSGFLQVFAFSPDHFCIIYELFVSGILVVYNLFVFWVFIYYYFCYFFQLSLFVSLWGLLPGIFPMLFLELFVIFNVKFWIISD